MLVSNREMENFGRFKKGQAIDMNCPQMSRPLKSSKMGVAVQNNP